jgi:cephalosporin-C deacetylase
VKKLVNNIGIIILFITLTGVTRAMAQVIPPDMMRRDTSTKANDDNDDSDDNNNANDISTSLLTGNKTATFDNSARYTYIVKNPTDNVQVGRVSYQVFTESGGKLNHQTIEVTIDKKSSGRYDFNIPESKPGFYKVSFTVNVTDYDDTTRRAFGIRPGELRASHDKPVDFYQFWK